MTQDEEIIFLLRSINDRLDKKRRTSFIDLFPLIIAFLSSVVLTIVSMYITTREKVAEEQAQQAAKESEEKFKKIEFLERFGQDLTSPDSIKSSIALFAIYSLDKKIAISITLALQVGRAKTQMGPFLASLPADERKDLIDQLSKTTFGLAQTNSRDLSYDSVLIKALGEVNSKTAVASKYINQTGLSPGSDAGIAFVLWCYQSRGRVPEPLPHNGKWGLDNLLILLKDKVKTFKQDQVHTAAPGDIAFFDFGEKRGPQACGIVYRIDNTFTYTLEFSDGKVQPTTRYLNDVQAFARVNEK